MVTHPTRTWLSHPAQARELDIEATLRTSSTDALRDRIDELIDDNRRIHERDCINLNPATNVLSPRAEAVLSGGLGTRPSLGHPGDKYEVGLEAIEELEVMTADLARRVFGSTHAEIRTFSGAMSNLMVFIATAEPGSPVIVPPATIGGHVTHNQAGAAGLYGLEIHEAPVDADRYSVDVDGVRALAHRVEPCLITIGASLNLTHHPVEQLREIADEVDAPLMFDAAHLCGPIAGGAWPNPLRRGALVMTMSTYKSLAGPAGGLIVTDDAEMAERIDAIAYPGLTANFDAGRTTALAVTLLDWLDHGEAWAQAMLDTAAVLAQALVESGIELYTTLEGPTRSHQLALRATDSAATVARLRDANLLTCAIGLPDGEGVRLGTSELVRWGMTADHMATVAGFVADALTGDPVAVADQVRAFRAEFTTIHFCAD